MPKSKREKRVSLTRTERKGLVWKQQIIDDIRRCVEKYPNIFVFHVENMRNNLLKDLRQEWKHCSRFIFGKNRVMQIALGRTKSEEMKHDLHKLSKRVTGQVGLLFTEKSKKDVLEWAKTFWALDYARSGFLSTETIVLPQGPLEEFSHAIEPYLRSLGMPTSLKKGVVTLNSQFKICEKCKIITPEQARILKLCAKPIAKFQLTITCSWTKSEGFELYIDDVNDFSVRGQEDDNMEESNVNKN